MSGEQSLKAKVDEFYGDVNWDTVFAKLQFNTAMGLFGLLAIVFAFVAVAMEWASTDDQKILVMLVLLFGMVLGLLGSLGGLMTATQYRAYLRVMAKDDEEPENGIQQGSPE